MWSNQRVRWLQRRGSVHLPGMRRRSERRAAGSVITTMADVADVPPRSTTSLDHGRTFQKHDEYCAQQKPGTRALHLPELSLFLLASTRLLPRSLDWVQGSV